MERAGDAVLKVGGVTEHMSKRRRRKRGKQEAQVPVAQSEQIASSTTNPQDPECEPETEELLEYMSEATYFQERSTLIEIEQKSADQHDKAILTISMGGLALSITFLKEIAPDPSRETLILVGISWLCFALSMLAILFSFLTSQIACRRQRDVIDELYAHGTRDAERKANRWASVTHWLNVSSYILVFLAVSFLAVFSWLNLG